MRLIGNILWFVLFCFVSELTYFVLGAIMCITIILIPFGKQCFKLATLSLMPFGAVIL